MKINLRQIKILSVLEYLLFAACIFWCVIRSMGMIGLQWASLWGNGNWLVVVLIAGEAAFFYALFLFWSIKLVINPLRRTKKQ